MLTSTSSQCTCEQSKELGQYIYLRTSRSVNNNCILTGEHDQTVEEGAEQVLDVSAVCFHDGFSMRHLRNDIAVLTLSTPVALSDKVGTVCLPQGGQHVAAGTKCYITGTTAMHKAVHKLSSISRKIAQNLSKSCYKLLKTFMKLLFLQSCSFLSFLTIF